MSYKHPKFQYDFPYLLELYEELEKQPKSILRESDAFRQAVLYYQTGDVLEGKERFRKIREESRRTGNTPLLIREFWRDARDPAKPRVTQARVTKITTEWRGEAYVDELKQNISIRPRNFSPPPREREVVRCLVRFDFHGPVAVPERFGSIRNRGN